MVELVVYKKPLDKRLINHSPFCAKSEIFLTLIGVEFRLVEFEKDPKVFPKGRLPVLKHNGNLLADSFFIQKFVEGHFVRSLDGHLSNFEKAQGFAFAKMCEEFFYWAMLHERWFIDSNWQKLKESYFSNIPSLLRGLITGQIRSGAKAAAKGHGMSCHSDEEVIQLGGLCLKALSDFLSDKKFLLGDKVSSYDCTMYAFVSSVLHSPFGPQLQRQAKAYENLVQYDDRMFQAVFSALQN